MVYNWDVFEEGYYAAEIGRDRADNPFQPYQYQFEDWDTGWLRGDENMRDPNK